MADIPERTLTYCCSMGGYCQEALDELEMYFNNRWGLAGWTKAKAEVSECNVTIAEVISWILTRVNDNLMFD